VPDALLRRARIFDFGEASLRSPTMRDETLTLAARARALGLTVCYAPNYRASAWRGGAAEAAAVQRRALALADIVIMNGEEGALLSDVTNPTAESSRLLAFGPRVVVITFGRDGAVVATPEDATPIPAVPVDVVFDIGAGDTYHAGLLAAWGTGADPLTAARFASYAAALKIAREPLPELLPTREEVLTAMASESD
jgi:2-dehydro-3-deoxygluconokinase